MNVKAQGRRNGVHFLVIGSSPWDRVTATTPVKGAPMPERKPLDPAVEWVEFVTTDADWDAAEPHLLTSMLSQLVLIRTF